MAESSSSSLHGSKEIADDSATSAHLGISGISRGLWGDSPPQVSELSTPSDSGTESNERLLGAVDPLQSDPPHRLPGLGSVAALRRRPGRLKGVQGVTQLLAVSSRWIRKDLGELRPRRALLPRRVKLWLDPERPPIQVPPTTVGEGTLGQGNVGDVAMLAQSIQKCNDLSKMLWIISPAIRMT
jgi:hypothetical protein